MRALYWTRSVISNSVLQSFALILWFSLDHEMEGRIEVASLSGFIHEVRAVIRVGRYSLHFPICKVANLLPSIDLLS